MTNRPFDLPDKVFTQEARSFSRRLALLIRALAVLSASSLAPLGCGGETPAQRAADGGGGAGGAKGGASGNGAGVAGTAGGQCPPLEYVFPPRVFREPILGAPLPSRIEPVVVADDAYVYFLESSAVYRVAAAGGAPEILQPAPTGETLRLISEMWLYKGQLLLASGGGLETMAVTGGPRSKLLDVPFGFITNHHTQLQGDLLFRGENGSDASGIVKVDLANKTATLLATGMDVVGWGVALARNQFLVGLGPDSLIGPSALNGLSLDGQMLAPIVPEIRLVPRIADDSYVYFSGDPDPRTFTGRYRMPVAGGTPEKIPDGPSLGLVAPAAGGLVSNGSGPPGNLSKRKAIWYLPWQGAPAVLGCTDGAKITGFDAIGASGRTAYASVGFTDKTATIARFTLP